MKAYSNYGVNLSTAKPWCIDGIHRETCEKFPIPLDYAALFDANAVAITTTAIAAADATTIAVVALIEPIPANTVLYFGASKKLALVTVAAVAGATSLTVQALPTALASGDIAYFNRYREVIIADGIVVGRTFAERATGAAFGPALYTDDEIYILAMPVVDPENDNTGVAYRHACGVFENLLPQWSTLESAADEVVTIAISGTLSGGAFKVGAFLSTGVFKWSEDIAYNANLAAIQAGYDTIFGASIVVIAGTVASHTVTFSGVGYTDIDQLGLELDTNELTGITSSTITVTTQGGAQLLNKIRALYQCRKGRDS